MSSMMHLALSVVMMLLAKHLKSVMSVAGVPTPSG
jgi:hypothetical protein